MRILALYFLLPIIAIAAPVCPAGTAVAYFRLEARHAGVAYAIPIDRVNRLDKGDTVVFFPSDPPVPTDVSGARVALLLLTPATGELRLLETRKANSRQEWVLPEAAGALAVAYGPHGFDESRMRQAATKDPELIAQLADYSEKTAQTETLLSALTGRRAADDRAVDAALQGLATSGGGSRLDRNAPLDQQTLSLFRTLNPAIHSYDPLAPETRQRWQQSATLAASVAGLFLGNTVGLAGGGAALFLNMRSILFPKTELRSAFLREVPEAAMCSAKAPATHTKLAYLWARQLPGGTAPALRLTKPAQLAIGHSSNIPLEAADADLASAGRAFRWRLVSAGGEKVSIPVTVPANQKGLRLGPIPKTAKPGAYQLVADWDWASAPVSGEITLHPVPDLSALRLTADTADRLIANTGAVRVLLVGAPTYFVSGVELLRLGDPLAAPVPLRFATGDALELEVDTSSLPAGPYRLTITQQGGGKTDLAVAIQLPAPSFTNLPLAVHEGPAATLTLSGERLERIEKITSKHAVIEWNPANRSARVLLATKAPALIDIEVQAEGRHQPIRIAGAIRSLGRRPIILSVTRAPQPAGSVARFEGEIDTAFPAAFSLRMEGSPATPEVTLACLGSNVALPSTEVKVISAESLYITVPARIPAKCGLTVSVNGSSAASLGRTVSLPAITVFALTDEAAAPGTFKGSLRGQGLEMIGRTGWSGEAVREVTALPAPDQTGAGQVMEIVMPWPAPAPHAALRVWLRGESEPRLTTSRY